MPFKSHTFTYDGATVAWYTAGKGNPLIILHGWGSSAEVMKPLAKRLSDIRNCVIVDLPGFGHSPEPPRAWDVGDYADMINSLMMKEFPDTPVDFLVHSFGGRIMLKLLSRPKTAGPFGKIIITGGAGLKPRRSARYYIKRFTATLLKIPVKLVIPSRRESAMNWLRDTAVWKSLGSSDYSKLTGVMRETFVKSVTEYFDDSLQSVDEEVLLLWGMDDKATPIAQGRRLEKSLKNGTLIEIAHAGHYVFLDQPGRFTAIARAYFDG